MIKILLTKVATTSVFAVSILTVAFLLMFAVSTGKLSSFAHAGDFVGGFLSPLLAFFAFYFSIKANEKAHQSEIRKRDIDVFNMHLSSVDRGIGVVRFYIHSSNPDEKDLERINEYDALLHISKVGECGEYEFRYHNYQIFPTEVKLFLDTLNDLYEYIDKSDSLVAKEFLDIANVNFKVFVKHLSRINDFKDPRVCDIIMDLERKDLEKIGTWAKETLNSIEKLEKKLG